MSEALFRAIKKATAPLMQRINNMMSRGVLTGIDNNQGYQALQATLWSGEVQDDMERVQQYGFTSRPPLGSEVIVIFPQGDRSHPIVLAVDNRALRPKDLNDEEGDNAMYSAGGNFIRLQAADGKIYIDAPHNVIIRSDETLRLEAKNIEIHADAKIKWDVGGRGFDYLPDRTNSHEQGSVSGSTNPIDPPEHGDPPAN